MFKKLAGILLALFLVVASPGGGSGGIVEVAIVNLLTGADSDVTTTNFADDDTITVQDGAVIVKICLIWTDGLLQPLDGSVYFFDADPTIATAAATLTVAEALTVVARFDFTTEEYQAQFATASVACKDVNSPYHSIGWVVYHHSDAGTLTTEAIDLHMWVK